MSPRVPPVLHTVIGNEITHCPLNLVPGGSHQCAVRMGKIHSFEDIYQAVKKGAEPELRDRIEIGERLYAAKKNCAELLAIVQSARQIAPLRRESVDSRLPAFLGLLSNLKREVNKGRDSDKHRRQLPNRCEHFPVHPINDSVSE